MTRPVYGLTVLRYEDGRTEVTDAIIGCNDGYGNADEATAPMPSDWRLRHAMLVDALAEVKREAGQPLENLEGLRACERCGEQVTESHAAGRCFNEQCEPQEMTTHDVAAPWAEVHGE